MAKDLHRPVEDGKQKHEPIVEMSDVDKLLAKNDAAAVKAAAQAERTADKWQDMQARVRPGATWPHTDRSREALAYVEAGFKIFPVWYIKPDGQCACGTKNCGEAGKHPRPGNGFKAATSNLAKIRKWWHEDSNYNIGFPCAMNRAVAVDVDKRSGGWETLAKLEAVHGPLISNVVAETGGDGAHRLFSDPRSSIRVPDTLGDGIDTRRNAYIVVAPSNHYTGGSYRWEEGKAPRIDQLLGGLDAPPLPKWCLEPKATDSTKTKPKTSAPVVPGEPTMSMKQVQLALDHIDNTDDSLAKERNKSTHAHWVTIGMACYAARGGGNDGRDAWIAWSAKNTMRFTKGHADAVAARSSYEQRWTTFGGEGPDGKKVTAGTLVEIARMNPAYEAARKAAGGTTGEEFEALDEAEAAEIAAEDQARLKAAAEAKAAADAKVAAKAEAEAKDAAERLAAGKPRKGSFADIVSGPDPQIITIVQNALRKRERVIVAGAPNSGKTPEMTHLCLCVAAGKPWHGRKVAQGGAMFFGSENLGEDRLRLRASQRHYGWGLDIPFHLENNIGSLNSGSQTEATDFEKKIIEVCETQKKLWGVLLRVIVIENLRLIMGGLSTSDEQAVMNVLAAIRRISVATGAAVFVIHHDVREGNRYAGTGAIEGAVDNVWHCTGPETTGGVGKIEMVKRRTGVKHGNVILYRFEAHQFGVDNLGDPIEAVYSCDVPEGTPIPKSKTSDRAKKKDEHRVKTTDASEAFGAAEDDDEKRDGMCLEVLRELNKANMKITRKLVVEMLNDRLKAQKMNRVEDSTVGRIFAALERKNRLLRTGATQKTIYTVLDN